MAQPLQRRHSTSKMGTRGQPAASRAAILRAAAEEFAEHGIAGARNEAIARAARVNKALLYYYFKDKETLYGAVLDRVFSGLAERVMEVLSRDLSPQAKYLGYVAAHFDYIASNSQFPRIAQRVWMRAARNASPHVRRIVDKYLRPIFAGMREVLAEGIRSGDLRPVDAMNFINSSVVVVVLCFSS